MVTISDIARKAKVSGATVSYVLSGKYRKMGVSEARAKEIRRIAGDLGYCRNDLAGSLASGKSNTIALLIPELPPCESQARILNGIMRGVNFYGLNFRIINVNGFKVAKVLNICASYRICGAVCYNLDKRIDLEALDIGLKNYNIPMVVAAGCHKNDKLINVTPDNLMGGRLIFQHLFKCGHRQFYMVNDYSSSLWSREHLQGFMEEASKVGLSEKNCLKVDFPKKPKFDLANLAAIFHSQEAPTAVVTWYDDVALQLSGMLGRLGKRIPEDISIIGYGNTSYSARCFPPLTTIEERLEEVGFESVKIIKNGTRKSFVPLEVKLVERDSCAENCP